MNLPKGIGAMALSATTKSKHHNLMMRTLTALIAIPFIVLIVYMGSIYFDLTIFVLSFLLLYEWSKLSTSSGFHPFGLLALGALGYKIFFHANLYEMVAVLGIIGAPFLLYSNHRKSFLLDRAFYILGCIYITFAMGALIFFNHHPIFSKGFILWIFCLVWATDTGAYFTGKLLGGPKLAPSISPKKTWSGFIGGTILGCISSVWLLKGLKPDIYHMIEIKFYWAIYALIAFLVICAHLGDLLESGLKRYYNTKDSGNLIPGHGGFLDRFDSMLLVATILFIILDLFF